MPGSGVRAPSRSQTREAQARTAETEGHQPQQIDVQPSPINQQPDAPAPHSHVHSASATWTGTSTTDPFACSPPGSPPLVGFGPPSSASGSGPARSPPSSRAHSVYSTFSDASSCHSSSTHARRYPRVELGRVSNRDSWYGDQGMLAAQALSAKQSTDSLDPYAYERPLDSARRVSQSCRQGSEVVLES